MNGRRPLRTGSGSERTNRAATVKERTETPKADNAGAARLRHPHVLTICDVFHQAETYAYAMEWIDGKSLAQVIEYLRQRREGGIRAATVRKRSSTPPEPRP